MDSAKPTRPWERVVPMFDYETTTTMLRDLDLVDADPEDVFDKFTRLARTVTGCTVALVSFVEEDRDRQVFKSALGLPPPWKDSRQTPLTHSFCKLVKASNAPLIVDNAPNDARVCDNLAIRDLNVMAYLGMPIHDPNWAPMGALCAIEPHPRTWSEADIAAMRDLAACVTDQIQLRAALHFR